MFDFPSQEIKPLRAELSGKAGKASIEIYLQPVHFPREMVEQEPGLNGGIESTIRLDFIELPTVELAELAGRTFDFPVNPVDGYIDGSIYLLNVHNPVDVTRISFGELQTDGLAVTFETFWNMEFEGDTFHNFNLTLDTLLLKVPVEA